MREAGLDPLYYYVVGGAQEERSANPGFDTVHELAQNPEVRASGMTSLLHHIRHGRVEGRIAVAYDEAKFSRPP